MHLGRDPVGARFCSGAWSTLQRLHMSSNLIQSAGCIPCAFSFTSILSSARSFTSFDFCWLLAEWSVCFGITSQTLRCVSNIIVKASLVGDSMTSLHAGHAAHVFVIVATSSSDSEQSSPDDGIQTICSGFGCPGRSYSQSCFWSSIA